MIRFLFKISAFAVASLVSVTVAGAAESGPPVELRDEGKSVILSNGTIQATINKAASTITSIVFGRNEMVSPKKPVYYSMGGGKSYRQPSGAAYRVVKQTPEIVDIAFLQKWKTGAPQAVDIEVHYALKRGESGVHTYAILAHPADYPETTVGEWRMVWGMPAKNDREWLMEKIRVDRLRDWEMPSPADLASAKPTDIKEIIEITKGVRAGKFDCKYDFNLEYYSTGCWGHASDKNEVGAWIVLGSHEFFNDGPHETGSLVGIQHHPHPFRHEPLWRILHTPQSRSGMEKNLRPIPAYTAIRGEAPTRSGPMPAPRPLPNARHGRAPGWKMPRSIRRLPPAEPSAAT